MEKISIVENQSVEKLTVLEKLLPNQSQRLFDLVGGRKNGKKLWNSLSLILGRFAASGLGFLTWMITARIYSAEEVGIASGVISAVMLGVQIAMIGLNSAFISLYPQYRKDSSKLVNTAINLTVITSLISATAFVFLSSTFFTRLDIVSHSLPYLLLFYGLSVFATINTLLDFVSIGFRDSKQVLFRNVLFGLLTISSVALIPAITGKAVSSAVLFGWMLASLAACILGGFQIVKTLSVYQYRPEIDLSIGKELFQIGIQNYVLTLGERAPNWIIPIMVTELLSPEENAYWYSLWMMVWVVYNIPISVGQNLFADLSHEKDNQFETIFFSIRTSLVLGIIGAVAAAMLARFALSLMGAGYAEAGTTPLRILLLGTLPFTVIQAYFGICRGTGKLTEAAIAAWVGGVLSVSAIFFIGKNQGLNGIAISVVAIQILIGLWAFVRMYFLKARRDVKV